MAEGDIIGEIDQLIFDPFTCGGIDGIRISAGVIALTWRSSRAGVNYGYLATIAINDYGAILGIIDTLVFEPVQCTQAKISHIIGDIYLIGYQGVDNDGWMRTVDIDSVGNIGGIIDSLEIEPVYGRDFRVLNVNANIHAVFNQNASDGWIRTLTINPNGTFGAIIDTQKFDTTLGAFPSPLQIAAPIYAVAYTGPDSDGWLKTWSIANNGVIAALQTASLEFDGVHCHSPQMTPIGGINYAIAYAGPPGPPSPDGHIQTVSITALGALGAIANFEFDATNCVMCSKLIPISGEFYALAYERNALPYIITLPITAAGAIGPVQDTLICDTVGHLTELVYWAYAFFAIAYSGPGGRGYIKTIGIERRVTPTVQTSPATEIT